MFKRISFLTYLLALSILLYAQPQKGTLVDIKVYPAAGQYDVSAGDPIDFEVIVYQYGKPVQSGVIEYIIGPEKFESGRMQAKIKNGKAHINGSNMTQPGFYRCYAYYTYEGADGSFIFYEDDGISYDYEKEEFATVELVWDYAARILTMGEMKVDYVLGDKQIRDKRIDYSGSVDSVDLVQQIIGGSINSINDHEKLL